jgi:aromatic ring-opening dioxygenase catalytic subunit (LigB family)
MRGFGQAASMQVSETFESYLNDAITNAVPEIRSKKLIEWASAPAARLAHPREDHLIPLMVVAGAAGQDSGHRVFVDKVMNVAMASYRFG